MVSSMPVSVSNSVHLFVHPEPYLSTYLSDLIQFWYKCFNSAMENLLSYSSLFK